MASIGFVLSRGEMEAHRIRRTGPACECGPVDQDHSHMRSIFTSRDDQ